jgi:hypothetical protein
MQELNQRDHGGALRPFEGQPLPGGQMRAMDEDALLKRVTDDLSARAPAPSGAVVALRRADPGRTRGRGWLQPLFMRFKWRRGQSSDSSHQFDAPPEDPDDLSF